jgi:hypothetical protein
LAKTFPYKLPEPSMLALPRIPLVTAIVLLNCTNILIADDSTPNAPPQVKKPATGFLEERSLDNYLGLKLADGSVVTKESFNGLSPSELSMLWSFANFPENARQSTIQSQVASKKRHLDRIAAAQAQGKTLESFHGLKLNDGRVVTAALLAELPLSAQAHLITFSFTNDRAKLLHEALSRLQADSDKLDVKLAELQTKDAANARDRAESAAKLAQQNAERERRRLETEAANARQAEQRRLDALARAEQEAQRAQEQAARAKELAAQEAARPALIPEPTTLAEAPAIAETLQPATPVATPSPLPVLANAPPPRSPHPTKSPKGNSHKSMEQFRQEQGMNEPASSSRFRLSGRSMKGLLSLGVLAVCGLFAVVRWMFSGGSNATTFMGDEPNPFSQRDNWR